MKYQFADRCPVCGGGQFSSNSVLWPELITAWQLTPLETAYVNRQQGFACTDCGNNLRSMALAAGVLKQFSFSGTLRDFCVSQTGIKILEINTAGNLTPTLKSAPGHILIEYPEFDMMDLRVESGSQDLVIHSDTLEHIPVPERALAECLRVLRPGGACIFTIPVIVDRMTRSRDGMAPSYHGRSGVPADDQVVWTEFGADAWKWTIKAGFPSCEIFSFEFPAALVIIAKTNL